LSPSELRELGLLHRQTSADLAAARTFHENSRVVTYLNDLALRSHNVVYRASRRSPARILTELWYDVPRTVRGLAGPFAVALLLFGSGALLGAAGTMLDETIAVFVLGSGFVQSVRDGAYLGRNMFGVVPHSVISAGLWTNNMTVALNMFAFGITGFVPAALLLLNGVMLGAVFVLCGRYEMLPRFGAFVVGHGVIEISALLIAGAAAFATFDGWVHPGERTRVEGLRRGARRGLVAMGATVPALVAAAIVEAFISPRQHVPAMLRVGLGVGLGALLWAWLLGTGKPGTDESAEVTVDRDA
jgi:uncharacterized membrane protein SpoIIM required for sporulation